MTPGPRRRSGAGRGTLLLAVLALAVVVLARPPHAPPLYDGLGFPDEPYRWVSAPAGSGHTAAATSASASLSIAVDGVSPSARGLSAEQGPQVAFALAAGALQLPSGGRTLAVTASPAAAPAPPPGGQVVSNLYRFASSPTPIGAVRLTAGAGVVVNLRADQATGRTVVVCAWDGRTWSQLATTQVGTDIYAARLSAFADIALVRLDPGVPVTATAASAAGNGSSVGSGPTAGAGQVAGAGPVAATQGAADPGAGPSGWLWIGLALLLGLIAAALITLRLRAPGDAQEPGATSG